MKNYPFIGIVVHVFLAVTQMHFSTFCGGLEEWVSLYGYILFSHLLVWNLIKMS